MSQGQLSDLFAAYPGNPQGVNPSIFNCKKGTLVVDTVSAVLYQKISQINDNSEYQQIGTTSSGGTTIQVTSTDTDSFGTAVTAALALTPSESNRVTILLPLDEYTQATNVTITSPYLTIQGNGKNATKVTFTSTAQLSIGAANVTLQSFHITRSGGSATAPLTTTVTSFATFLDGVELNDMRISNPSTAGVAIQTFAGKSHNCTIDSCTTGIYQNYGGIHENTTITAAQYAVRYSQSAISTTSQSLPFASSRPVIFDGCKLTQTDTTGGHVIQGLIESATMNTTTTANINWFATRINGGKIHAACAVSGDTAATSEAIRGCIHLNGVGVDGDRFTTFWFDSYANACYWSAQHSGATSVMTGVDSCIITGGSIVHSNTAKVFGFTNAARMNGVSFEQDATKMIGYDQWRLYDCADVSGGPIGWKRKDLALLVDRAGAVCETDATTDYNLATICVEMWVKLNASSASGGIISLADAGNHGFYLSYERATNQIYGGFNPASSATIVQTNCSALFGSNTTSGPYSDGWHHIAMTLASSVQRLWLDGVEKTTAGSPPAGTTTVGTLRLILGGQSFNSSPATDITPMNGIIHSVRIKSALPYTTGNTYTPKRRFALDSTTVGLWSWDTSSALVWEDKTAAHDANLIGSTPAVWVRQGHTP